MQSLRIEEQKPRLRRMWLLAWPAIIEQILGTLVNYVDTAMVGSMGATGTAAVSVNGPVIWLIGGILTGVGVGYSVQVSNAVGAGDVEKVKTTLRQAVLAVLVCGSLACLLYEVLGGKIPYWLGAKPEVLPHAVNYLRIYAAALLFRGFQAVFGTTLRCMGNSKTPMVLNTMANLMNMVLNFLFIYPTRTWEGITIPILNITVGEGLTIYGMNWGVEGAAIATAISVAVTGLWMCLSALRQGQYATSLREGMKPDPIIIRRAVRLGVPSALQNAIVNIGQIFMTSLVAHELTTVALAANQIAVTAESFCYMPAGGIGMAATALVGQAVGAREKEDADAYGALTGGCAFLLCCVTGTILYLAAPVLAGFFNTDRGVVALAAMALQIVSIAEPFQAVNMVLSSALRGADDVRFPMVIGLVGMWCVRVPLAYLFVLGMKMDLAGVWVAMTIDLIVRGVLCILRWKSGKWKKLSGLEA